MIISSNELKFNLINMKAFQLKSDCLPAFQPDPGGLIYGEVQVNKFENVPLECGGAKPRLEQGAQVNKFEQIQVVVSCGPPVDRQTDTIENITFPQLRWRAI